MCSKLYADGELAATPYEMDISDDVWLCTHKLKEIGVDVEDWYRQKE